MKGIFYKEFEQSYIPEILKEIYKDKIYTRFFRNKKDLTVIDAGGNIGLFTLYASDYAKKIFTIEPSAQHVEVINQMVDFNGLTDKVTVIQKAIAMENGTEEFHHNKNVTMFSLKDVVDDKSSPTEKVETIRFDTLFKDNNITHVDFLKLDIEGSEVEVVGGKGFENVADKIDALVVEYHRFSGRNPSQLVTTLTDYGFNVFPIPSDAMLFGAIRKP